MFCSEYFRSSRLSNVATLFINPNAGIPIKKYLADRAIIKKKTQAKNQQRLPLVLSIIVSPASTASEVDDQTLIVL